MEQLIFKKKFCIFQRWLRQAMFDNSSYEEPLTIDPNGIEGFHFDNGYLSPTGQGELSSPGAVDGMF